MTNSPYMDSNNQLLVVRFEICTRPYESIPPSTSSSPNTEIVGSTTLLPKTRLITRFQVK